MDLGAWIEHCSDAMRSAGLAFGHGTDNALDEAAWLVSAATGMQGADIAQETVPDDDAVARIEALLERRISSRKPLAYLLGEAWFCGLRFEINEQVLVPRSPIAELITGRFRPWLRPENIHNVLDLCTGSGALAVATALVLPDARLVASDISATALQVAQRNARLHSVESRIECMQSDLFENLPGGGFDLILSNPPYVAQEVFKRLPSEYHAEPELSLVSAAGGLDLPLRILSGAAQYLAPGGMLVCEVGESAEALHRALPGLPLTWIEFDQGGDGVFIMDREALVMHRAQVHAAQEALANVV